MRTSTQTVLIFGLFGFVLYQLRRVFPEIGSVVSGAVGAVGDVAGGIAQGIIVPSGPNKIAVSYWQSHGLDYSAFMEIARGDQPVPAFLRIFLPVSFTVDDFFAAFAMWSTQTTIGDLEAYIMMGLPGNSDEFVMNVIAFSDATLWRLKELDTIRLGLTAESLLGRVL